LHALFDIFGTLQPWLDFLVRTDAYGWVVKPDSEILAIGHILSVAAGAMQEKNSKHKHRHSVAAPQGADNGVRVGFHKRSAVKSLRVVSRRRTI
jgi:hypothetical protein